jgi:hypothetical protein
MWGSLRCLDINLASVDDVLMRTTLTLDEDVAKRVKEFMRRRKLTLKSAVNEMLRQSAAPAGKTKPQKPVRITPHKCGAFQPGVDFHKLAQHLDDLEVESFLGKGGR